jgi:acetyl-CoA synthetase
MPHEIKGEAIYAFVTLKQGVTGNDDLRKELVGYVRTAVGPIASIS